MGTRTRRRRRSHGRRRNSRRALNAWRANASKGNPPMRNLAARMLSDLSDPSGQGLFLADFKGEHYGDLLLEIDWNRGQILCARCAAVRRQRLRKELSAPHRDQAGDHDRDEPLPSPRAQEHGAPPGHKKSGAPKCATKGTGDSGRNQDDPGFALDPGPLRNTPHPRLGRGQCNRGKPSQ